MQLETDRLTIRPFTVEDLPEFVRLLDIPEVSGWRMQKDNARGFLEWTISNYARMDIARGIVCFGTFERRSGRVLGAVGAGEHDDLHEPEVFYNPLPRERGNGYATEAARAVTDWALSHYDIPYLIGTAEIGNTASQHVLERCGYTYIDTRTLVVHISNQRHEFRYYRRYRSA